MHLSMIITMKLLSMMITGMVFLILILYLEEVMVIWAQMYILPPVIMTATDTTLI